MTMCLLCHNAYSQCEYASIALSGTDPWKTEEVRVRVGAALRAVDLVQVFERELELRRESLDASAEVTLSEWRELVEERLDDRRVENDHGHLEDQPGVLSVPG